MAERAVTKLRSSLAAAGGGLRGAAAKLPADQAIALFDFAGEEVRGVLLLAQVRPGCPAGSVDL